MIVHVLPQPTARGRSQIGDHLATFGQLDSWPKIEFI